MTRLLATVSLLSLLAADVIVIRNHQSGVGGLILLGVVTGVLAAIRAWARHRAQLDGARQDSTIWQYRAQDAQAAAARFEGEAAALRADRAYEAATKEGKS